MWMCTALGHPDVSNGDQRFSCSTKKVTTACRASAASLWLAITWMVPPRPAKALVVEPAFNVPSNRRAQRDLCTARRWRARPR